MEDIEQLARAAAQSLGLQLSRGRESRYVGVLQQRSTGKWRVRKAGVISKSNIFDLEIQAALDVRVQQLDFSGQSQEATEMRQVQEALQAIAPELLKILCSCRKPGASCHCQEKALREAESAKAALEAIRAVAAQAPPGPVVPAGPPPPAPPVEVTEPRAKTIDEYYSIETVRRQHQLDRRRAKESRRRWRRQQLEGTLETQLQQTGQMTGVGSADASGDTQGFTTLWRHFLQQVRRAKRRRRFQDPEGRGFSAALLERLGGGRRVIGFHQAALRLQQLQLQQEARRRLQQSAETGAMVPMTPEGRHPDISANLEVDEPRRRPKRLRTPTDILLKRLVLKRRKEAEEAQEAAGDEVKVVSMELDAVKGELAQMAKSKAAKLEWLLLQRLAPEPVLTNVTLCDEERAAQLEEERLQKLWELEGGAEEEERIAKEWRGILRQRRQSFLALRGAHRWRRRPKEPSQPCQPQPEPAREADAAAEAPAATVPEAEPATVDPYL